MSAQKFYCTSCDKKRSPIKGVICPACFQAAEDDRETKPFAPKFAQIYNKPNCNAADLVTSWLDGSDYERGRLETVASQAENVSEAFGRLIQILYDKKVLTKEDVATVAGAYEYEARDI